MAKLNPIHHRYINSKKQKAAFDHFINVIAFLGPLTGVPQVIRVFETGANDVSLSTWVGFTAYNVLFLTYGIYYRLKPIIIANFLWMIIEGSVVIGIIIDRLK